MTSPLDKPCTGYLCENTAGCPHFRKSTNPFEYISPLSFHEKCPYWPPSLPGWGVGPEDPTK